MDKVELHRALGSDAGDEDFSPQGLAQSLVERDSNSVIDVFTNVHVVMLSIRSQL